MSDAKARVAVYGSGVIGKRVDDAAALRDGMELADVASDDRIRVRCSAGWSS